MLKIFYYFVVKGLYEKEYLPRDRICIQVHKLDIPTLNHWGNWSLLVTW